MAELFPEAQFDGGARDVAASVARAAARSAMAGFALVRGGVVVDADAAFRDLVGRTDAVGRRWDDLIAPVVPGAGPQHLAVRHGSGGASTLEVTAELVQGDQLTWTALVVPTGAEGAVLAQLHDAEASARAAARARRKAESDRDVAVDAREVAELARDVARRAQQLAESDRDVAVDALGMAEAARDVARWAQQLAESDRDAARRAQELAESDRDRARLDRDVSAEEARHNADTADALVRSVLPKRLPTVPGASLAAHYAPASTTGIVGGDWYDALVLPDGRLFLCVGDAVGNGLPAAAVMGRLANAARVAALLDPDPAAVVDVMDRVLRAYEPETMATAVVAVYDPERRSLRWVRAGHPPPALARPGQGAQLVEPPAYPPVGVPPGLIAAPPPVQEVRLPSGSVCALFTDGLVERRGEHIDVGLARITTVLGAPDLPDDAERIAARLIDVCALDDTDDDVCLLLLVVG